MIGRTVAHYRILGQLGAGGMGVVWRALDTKLEREVALKMLPPDVALDVTARARLLREARLASALNHPNICTIHEVGESDGIAYIAMELVPGRRLDEVIAGRPLPPETVARHGAQIADALGYAHEHGVVHRDLKPSNVIVGESGRLKVLDFGIAARLPDPQGVEATRETLPGTIVGTPGAMAPEILRGATADARSDLWSLGVVLHEMAGGSAPFRGTTPIERDVAVLHAPPAPLPPHVPPGLAAVIARCLAKDPAQRYRQAAEVRAALEALVPGGAARMATPSGGRARRFVLPAAAFVAALLAAIALFDVGGVRSRLVPGTGGPGGGPKIRSLAVLPLDNLSQDPQQQYFADGMTEELTTALARIGSLRVISRTSAMRFRDSPLSLQEIARQLKVDAIVEGSIQRSGDRVRITAQLIRAATDEHLWADSFDRTLSDALALQSEVAAAIADQVHAQLTPAQRSRLGSVRPVSPRAYELYLRGLDAYRTWDPNTERAALEIIGRAIREDSTYAPAWALLAFVYLQHPGPAKPDEETALARKAAQRAIALDPELGMGHAVLGEIEYEGWDWAASEREFLRAVALSPSSFEAHHSFSHLLLTLGRIAEAHEHSRIALELDPLNTAALVHMGWQLVVERRFAEATEHYREALRIDPGYTQAHMHLFYIALLEDRPAEAAAHWNRIAAQADRPDSLWFQAMLAIEDGRPEEAARRVTAMEDDYENWVGGILDLAAVLEGLGRRDEAFEWLERAAARREMSLSNITENPFLRGLREDPRYDALVRRMGLPGRSAPQTR